MKNRIFTLLFLTFLISAKSIACDCAIPESLKAIQNYEFENSEYVFIGEVLKIDSNKNTFEIRVIESFKGNGKIYSGIYDEQCGPIINETGKWLIYANYNSDNLIEIISCGITRSFENPEHGNATKSPPPSNKNGITSLTEKKRIEWRLRAKSDLENEIIELRKRTE